MSVDEVSDFGFAAYRGRLSASANRVSNLYLGFRGCSFRLTHSAIPPQTFVDSSLLGFLHIPIDSCGSTYCIEK